MKNELKIKLIADWISANVDNAKASGFIFGLSGGIDSALIAAIASKYFPKNHLALRMNINSSEEDILDQKMLTKFFNLNYQDINLETSFKSMSSALKLEKPQLNNFISRLRTVSLYGIGQKLNYLVLGTSNYNEIYTGYYTKNGDGACDILPLANLTKFEIWQLSKTLNIPKKIIEKIPSAGFYASQSDEKELGVTYQQMEDFFRNKKVDLKIKKIIQNLHRGSKHKRDFPKTIINRNKILWNGEKNE